MDADAHVHFLELAGPDAEARLAAQARRWRRDGYACRLLHSAERDDLWLLVASGATPPSAPSVDGARHWRFTATAAEPT